MVLEADHVDEGATLDELTLPTNRERAAAVARNANLTTTPGVVPPIPLEKIRPIAH